MKKGLLFLLFGLLLLLSYKTNPNINKSEHIYSGTQTVLNDNLEEKEENITVNLEAKIHPSLPVFVFRISGKKPDEKSVFYRANKLLIIEKGNEEKVIQEIRPNEDFINTDDLSESIDPKSLGLEIEDMNFDGFKDIRIQCIAGTPNTAYYYWLWDVKTSSFVRNVKLEEITSPEVDIKNQTIKSFASISLGEHAERVYKYVNGKPKLVWEENTVADTDRKVVHVTVRALKGNRMEVIKKYDVPLEN